MKSNSKLTNTEKGDVRRESYRAPEFRVRNTEDEYVAEIAIPGVPKSGVEIGLENDVLTVTARRQDKVPESWKPLARELSTSDYRLKLELNAPIDPERITAKVEDGLLMLTLPVKETAKPRLVEVS